jgi:hypothetical protein
MKAPTLLNALQIAWVQLLQDELITPINIEAAPLQLVAAVLEAASKGEEDERSLARAALFQWRLQYEAPSPRLH